MNSNGASGGGRDEKTPEEKHRAHVAEMDRLRAREEVCSFSEFLIRKLKNLIKFLGRNFECSSSPKRII